MKSKEEKPYKRSRSRSKPCGVCGVGTVYEICVKCAERLAERSQEDTKAVGAIPAPAVTPESAERWVQLSFLD